ncbi:ribonucleoside hydrolase RihC [Microlunatus panaciterrae]|uniref:Purine nucleosidase n=1 Tax=Microlunatus panaciterrae TaxID=400768 RepID=A0ABS2RM08_9ACTN|nr:purine nucleosidase [Microlunatus panaciterrae]
MNVALDTDIGTDVDDLLALAVLFGSPELDLVAVTTVYGDTQLRAQMVARAYRAALRDLPPIVPGLRQPRSGREIYWPGHEGDLMPDLGRESVDADLDAADVLARTPLVIGIGPLTNIAEAVERPGCGIEQLYLMGGNFPGGIEHNISCDVVAAAAVFEAQVPVTIIGIDQTSRARIDPAAVELFDHAGDFGQLVAAHVLQYWQVTGRGHNTPHDPLAVLMITNPELFTFVNGTITVTETSKGDGRTEFSPDPAGPHRIVADFEVAAATEEIVRRICAAPQPL